MSKLYASLSVPSLAQVMLLAVLLTLWTEPATYARAGVQDFGGKGVHLGGKKFPAEKNILMSFPNIPTSQVCLNVVSLSKHLLRVEPIEPWVQGSTTNTMDGVLCWQG